MSETLHGMNLSSSSSEYLGPERHRPPEVGEDVDYRLMRINVEGKPWLRGYAVFWVVFDGDGNASRWGQAPGYPVGTDHAAFLESMRAYSQAIHKPILDSVTGRPVEDPMCRRTGGQQKA